MSIASRSSERSDIRGAPDITYDWCQGDAPDQWRAPADALVLCRMVERYHLDWVLRQLALAAEEVEALRSTHGWSRKVHTVSDDLERLADVVDWAEEIAR